MSSYVCKPSSLAFAGLLAAISLSQVQAQEFVIADTETTEGRFVGINLPTENFLEDVVVTTGSLPEKHKYV